MNLPKKNLKAEAERKQLRAEELDADRINLDKLLQETMKLYSIGFHGLIDMKNNQYSDVMGHLRKAIASLESAKFNANLNSTN